MNFKGHNRIDPGFSLSSMTDLVFLLLVFFVIVSTMVSPYALPVDLPKGTAKSKDAQPQVVLRLEADGACTINGQAADPAQLESILKAEMARHDKSDAIVFRAAAQLPTGRMVDVLDMAKRNQWKIVLAAAPMPAAAADNGTAAATAATATNTP